MAPLKYGGVVDSDRLVYGLKGLREADFSVWPFSPPGSVPSATAYAVGEKVGDLVVRESRHIWLTFK